MVRRVSGQWRNCGGGSTGGGAEVLRYGRWRRLSSGSAVACVVCREGSGSVVRGSEREEGSWRVVLRAVVLRCCGTGDGSGAQGAGKEGRRAATVAGSGSVCGTGDEVRAGQRCGEVSAAPRATMAARATMVATVRGCGRWRRRRIGTLRGNGGNCAMWRRQGSGVGSGRGRCF